MVQIWMSSLIGGQKNENIKYDIMIQKNVKYIIFFYVYTIIIKTSYNIIFAHDHCELPI